MSLSTPELTTVPIDAGLPTKLKPEIAYSAENFDTWCSRLYLAPRVVMYGRRTGSFSTCVDEREIPNKISYWHDCLRWVERWRTKMLLMGLGNVWVPTYSGVGRAIIGSEPEVTTSLFNDFFNTIDKFNYDLQAVLRPGEVPISDCVRVIAVPTAGLGVFSHPEKVICDRTAHEVKVGFGEVKPAWVMKTSGALTFANRLPFNHFGEDFIANIESEDSQKNVGKGLTQLYSDLLNEGVSLGFLATTETFFFCCINPEDRGEFQIFPLVVDRIDLPRNGAPSPFTIQMGLATLAWMGRKPIFGEPREMPRGLALWKDYDPSYRERHNSDNERSDPSYQPGNARSTSRSRSRSHPSGLSQQYGYQNRTASDFCTAACLKALRDDLFHPGCPNVLYHRSAGATLKTVLEDLEDHHHYRIVSILGEGRSSRCYSVRSEQGYQVVVKAYKETADRRYFKQELEVYDHLAKLQGLSIPVIISSTRGVFVGDRCNMIFMSYGGVAAEKNPVINDFLVDRLVKAFTEIHALGVYHEDLALRNILIDKDRVAIIDFENSHIANPDDPQVVEEQKWALARCEKVKESGEMKDFRSKDVEE